MRPVEGGFGLGCGLVQCSIVLFLEVVLLDGGIVELNARVLTDRRAFMFRDLTKDYTWHLNRGSFRLKVVSFLPLEILNITHTGVLHSSVYNEILLVVGFKLCIERPALLLDRQSVVLVVHVRIGLDHGALLCCHHKFPFDFFLFFCCRFTWWRFECFLFN